MKQKRRVTKRIIERIWSRFRVSVSETDYHDLHQRAEITLALVARNDADAERMVQRIRDLVDDDADCTLTYWQPQMLSC